MAGFYGKLPSKGDFITRGLQRNVVDSLHNFFQQGLQTSRLTIGEKWLEHYAVAPIWHFYIPKGVIDENKWLGIWIASVDSVNRSFPLILLDTIEQPITELNEFNAYLDWFTECEELMLDVVHGDIEFDQFCTQVASKTCYQKFHSIDDIDAIFEDVQTKTPETKPNTSINLDHLTPSTPFEKALLSKIGMLEFLLNKVCDKQGLDYQVLVNEFIDGLTLEQKDSSSNIGSPQTLQDNVNLGDAHNLFESDDAKNFVQGKCIWSSDGNENIRQQLVFSPELPAAEDFYKFLQGF